MISIPCGQILFRACPRRRFPGRWAEVGDRFFFSDNPRYHRFRFLEKKIRSCRRAASTSAEATPTPLVVPGLEQPRGLQAFCKLYQISAVFVQAFPKFPLGVLGNFKGLQAPPNPKSRVTSFLPPRTLPPGRRRRFRAPHRHSSSGWPSRPGTGPSNPLGDGDRPRSQPFVAPS